MRTIKLGIKRTLEEFAYFATDMAAINPNGFRKPGKKRGSTSLVEQAAIAAGHMDPVNDWERSKRGQRKEDARLFMLEEIERERLEGIPDKYLHSAARRRRVEMDEAA